jgi:cysteine dioxygenase
MKKVSIENLIHGLCEIPEPEFSCQTVYAFLGANPVDAGTIDRYIFWDSNCYTRNLIYKDERFELMAICWDKGQSSEIDESRGHCKLIETDSFDLSDCLAAKVELEEPIHQILNLAEFDERAVSIHIYSKPFDSCISYCRDTDTFKEVPLFYTSIDGIVCRRHAL